MNRMFQEVVSFKTLHISYCETEQKMVPIKGIFLFSIRVHEQIIEFGKIVGVVGEVFTEGLFYGLICTALKRGDGDHWRDRPTGIAILKIGSSKISRVPEFEARHPFGTTMTYPFYSGFGTVQHG